jgi:hypothetical protein
MISFINKCPICNNYNEYQNISLEEEVVNLIEQNNFSMKMVCLTCEINRIELCEDL